MGLGSIFLLAILLFVIIYVAVRLAIKPLLEEPYEDVKFKRDNELARIRDIGIIRPNEYDDVIELYRNRDADKADNELWLNYGKVLDELKEIGYFTDEEYSRRIEELKSYFKVII